MVQLFEFQWSNFMALKRFRWALEAFCLEYQPGQLVRLELD